MKWTWTGKPFVLIPTEELGMRKICAQMVPRILTEQQRDGRLRAVFDIQMHYGDAAASFVTWPRTLRHISISKSRIDSERTPFWFNRKHPEVCNARLKLHHTKCVPRTLQRMAAPLEKVCAGTRDVLWRWPRFSWWISKIKLFFETSLITLLSDLVLILLLPSRSRFCHVSYDCILHGTVEAVSCTKFWATFLHRAYFAEGM